MGADRPREASGCNGAGGMMAEILKSVPVGEANATSSREIWKAVDCWAEVTISRRLAEATDAKQVRRRKHEIKHGFVYLYWRESAE